MRNTGKVAYAYLEEYDISNNMATGNYKANVPTDPDYVAPYIDLIQCPIPSIAQDISTLQAFVVNRSQQFLSFSNVKVKADNSEYAFDKDFAKGPGQSEQGSIKQLLGEFLSVNVISTSSSANQPIFIEVRWGSEAGDLLAVSSEFVAGIENWERVDIPLSYIPLAQQEKVFLVIKQGASTTTTTTALPTTTTTTTAPTVIGPFNVAIGSISCVNSAGSDPMNYDVVCEGSVSFAISDPTLANISSGSIRLKSALNSDYFSLKDFSDTLVAIDTIYSITEELTVQFNGPGATPPGAYPNGYPLPGVECIYTFEYKPLGSVTWTTFELKIVT